MTIDEILRRGNERFDHFERIGQMRHEQYLVTEKLDDQRIDTWGSFSKARHEGRHEDAASELIRFAKLLLTHHRGHLIYSFQPKDEAEQIAVEMYRLACRDDVAAIAEIIQLLARITLDVDGNRSGSRVVRVVFETIAERLIYPPAEPELATKEQIMNARPSEVTKADVERVLGNPDIEGGGRGKKSQWRVATIRERFRDNNWILGPIVEVSR